MERRKYDPFVELEEFDNLSSLAKHIITSVEVQEVRVIIPNEFDVTLIHDPMQIVPVQEIIVGDATLEYIRFKAFYIIENVKSRINKIKQDHQLIRSGPYAHVRHPIYTGILLAVAGTALVVGEYRAILGVILICLGFARKAKKEEVFLSTQFGPAFDEHKRRTGFFLPRFS